MLCWNQLWKNFSVLPVAQLELIKRAGLGNKLRDASF